MKKLMAVLLVGVLAASLAAAPATAAKKKKKKPVKQEVSGTIMFPAPFAQGTFDGCWGGLHRRVTTPTNGAAGQGVFGYHFDVDEATWGSNFVLEATGGQGTVDLDLFLYTHVPPVSEWPNDPQNAGTPTSTDYTTREPGGEAGVVPQETVFAIVCMYGGPTHAGLNAGFTYTAGTGVKIPKG